MRGTLYLSFFISRVLSVRSWLTFMAFGVAYMPVHDLGRHRQAMAPSPFSEFPSARQEKFFLHALEPCFCGVFVHPRPWLWSPFPRSHGSRRAGDRGQQPPWSRPRRVRPANFFGGTFFYPRKIVRPDLPNAVQAVIGGAGRPSWLHRELIASSSSFTHGCT